MEYSEREIYSVSIEGMTSRVDQLDANVRIYLTTSHGTRPGPCVTIESAIPLSKSSSLEDIERSLILAFHQVVARIAAESPDDLLSLMNNPRKIVDEYEIDEETLQQLNADISKTNKVD